MWNVIWSNMLIESTFVRYGHHTGGLLRLTLKPSAVTRCILSLHTCSQMRCDRLAMKDKQTNKTTTTHKEEAPIMFQEIVRRSKKLFKITSIPLPQAPTRSILQVSMRQTRSMLRNLSRLESWTESQYMDTELIYTRINRSSNDIICNVANGDVYLLSTLRRRWLIQLYNF